MIVARNLGGQADVVVGKPFYLGRALHSPEIALKSLGRAARKQAIEGAAEVIVALDTHGVMEDKRTLVPPERLGHDVFAVELIVRLLAPAIDARVRVIGLGIQGLRSR